MTPVKMAAYPRDPNPYQEMLHSALRAQDIQVGYLPTPTPSRTLNLLLLPATLVRSRLSGTRILHLHWVFAFELPGSSTVPAMRLLAQLWFGLVLLCCRALGISVVWTAHNVLPHDRVFWDDRAGRRMLLKSASHVIVHDLRVIDELAALLPRPDDLPPVTLIPHGSYAGWYAQDLSQAEARAKLGLPYEATVLLFFGRVNRQKGADSLALAFAALGAGRDAVASQPVLVVAGRCSDGELASALAAAAASLRDRMRLDLRFLPDDELAVYLTAADAAVLPFRAATTSGSVVLAMTMGRITVLPDLAAFDGLPPEALISYDHTDPDGLRTAMAEVCDTPREELSRRGAAARDAAGGVSWAEAARRTAAVYRSSLVTRATAGAL